MKRVPPQTEGTIAGLILAAGESRRMGRDKALLTFRGRTFLETILLICHDAGLQRVFVVLGHRAEEIQNRVKLEPAEIVVNPNYRDGQTSSLQAGLRALAGAELRAIVLFLVDHPAISPATVSKLVETFRQTNSLVVIPTFQNHRGHPVLISCALFEEIMNLNSDEGANAVIRRHVEATRFAEVDDPGILTDVDDSEAYFLLQDRE